MEFYYKMIMGIELNLLVTFVSGLLIGLTPCILLMLSAFGGSLILIEEKGKFIKISLGLILGFVSSYLIMTILILSLSLTHIFESILFKIIFAAVLIGLGIWQILESKKDDSIIFGTNIKVKKVLKNFIEKNSAIYAFLVGIIFTLIKIPCFSSVYLAIISNVATSPVLILYIIFYIIGVTVPIVLILILFRLGLEIEKVDKFRMKYRPYLRALSGVILIFLSIYLLLYP